MATLLEKEFIEAVIRNNLVTVIDLVNGGVNPSCEENYAISKACEFGYSDIVDFLISTGKCNLMINNGYPVRISVYRNHYNIARKLIETGKINIEVDNNFIINKIVSKPRFHYDNIEFTKFILDKSPMRESSKINLYLYLTKIYFLENNINIFNEYLTKLDNSSNITNIITYILETQSLFKELYLKTIYDYILINNKIDNRAVKNLLNYSVQYSMFQLMKYIIINNKRNLDISYDDNLLFHLAHDRKDMTIINYLICIHEINDKLNTYHKRLYVPTYKPRKLIKNSY